jgi:hypothetical protein
MSNCGNIIDKVKEKIISTSRLCLTFKAPIIHILGGHHNHTTPFTTVVTSLRRSMIEKHEKSKYTQKIQLFTYRERLRRGDGSRRRAEINTYNTCMHA